MSPSAAATDERLAPRRLLPWVLFALCLVAGLVAYVRYPQAVAPLLTAEETR